MKNFQIVFETYCQETNSFEKDALEFEGEDVLHIINQTLDFFRQTTIRVCTIESVTKI